MKSVYVLSFPGPYFPEFGLNTERYEGSLRIQSHSENTDQKNPNTDIFHATVAFLRSFQVYWPPDLGTLINSWFLCENIFLRVIFKRSPRFPPIHSNPKVFWKRWTWTFCKFYRKIPGCNLIHKFNICYYLLY